MSDSFGENKPLKNSENENNVIQLPTRIRRQYEARQKLQSQRFAAAISLGSVIMISLFLNQFLTQQRAQRISVEKDPAGQRFIASAPEDSSAENLSWEVRLAKDLNQ